MVITGAKSEDLAEQAAKQYAKMIRKCSGKKNITMTKFHIENIVANVNAYFKIELENTSCEIVFVLIFGSVYTRSHTLGRLSVLLVRSTIMGQALVAYGLVVSTSSRLLPRA